MKFADGFWLNQRGYEVNYANQAFEIEEIENGFLVVATPFVVYNRAMMLGSANLEIAYTSTQENCVKVSITHHKGHVDNGPHFVLEDKGFKPQVTVTDKEAVLVTGDTKLVVSKENWSFTYYYKDKKLTSGGWRSTGVISRVLTSSRQDFRHSSTTHSGATLPIPQEHTSESSSTLLLANISTASARNSQHSQRTVRTLRYGTLTEVLVPISLTSLSHSIFLQRATVYL